MASKLFLVLVVLQLLCPWLSCEGDKPLETFVEELKLPPTPFPPVRGVLVNSAGGQGTTYIMEALESWRVKLNLHNDGDGLKHKNARVYRQEGLVHDRAIRPKKGVRFNRIIYLVGPPLHSILSTTRRFGLSVVHRGKLGCPDCRPPPPGYRKKGKGAPTPAEYELLFNRTEALGYDAYGWHFHLGTWVEAQMDRTQCKCWPPIWIVDLETLIKNPCIFSNFVGVSYYRASALTFRQSTSAQSLVDMAHGLMSENTSNIYDSLERFTQRIVHGNLEAFAQVFNCRPVYTKLSSPSRRQ